MKKSTIISCEIRKLTYLLVVLSPAGVEHDQSVHFSRGGYLPGEVLEDQQLYHYQSQVRPP